MRVAKVCKRNGEVVPFDLEKIADSIFQAARSTGGFRQDIDLLSSFTPRAERIYRQFLDLKEGEISGELALQSSAYLEGYLAGIEEHVPSVEQVQDAIEEVLKGQGFLDVWESYRLFRWGRAAVRAGHISNEQFSKSGLPDEKWSEAKRWNRKQGVDTLEGLSTVVADPRAFRELIGLSTERYELDLDEAVRKFKDNPLPVIVVAGPSASGKTTTTNKIIEKLEAKGHNCKLWTLDNYYRGLKQLKEDQFQDYNYETPEALHVPMVQRHLSKLLEGKEVKQPFYDFEKGEREGYSKKMVLREGDILIIDSLYGFSPVVFPEELNKQFFRVYIEPLNPIIDGENERKVKLTDTRLLRRMARDSRPQSDGGRGYPVEHTLGHWHYVRNEELRSLIPYLPTADHVVNGGLAFELPVLKGVLYARLPKLEEFFQQRRLDAYIRGMRVRGILDKVTAASDKYVPEDSVLREFVGEKK